MVLPGPVSGQVGVVGGGRVGDRLGAPGVEVTQVVGQLLQFISGEVAVIPEHLVVTGSTGALNKGLLNSFVL